jgi:septal ring factor EnvC (AmiA/AmiB activator)
MNESAIKNQSRKPVPNAVTMHPASTSNPSDLVSDQLTELNAEVLDTLSHLNALIDNRGAWGDAIEGCREAVTLLRTIQGRLHEIVEGAQKVESDLASARDESARSNKMYAELSAVERNLRTECERYRKLHADLVVVEQEMRAECGKKQAALEKQATSLANARALAAEMIREIGGEAK